MGLGGYWFSRGYRMGGLELCSTISLVKSLDSLLLRFSSKLSPSD